MTRRFVVNGSEDWNAGNINTEDVSPRIVYDGAMRSGKTTAANLMARQVGGQVLTMEALLQRMNAMRILIPHFDWNTESPPTSDILYRHPAPPMLGKSADWMTIEDPMRPGVNIPFDKRTKAEQEAEEEAVRKWERRKLYKQLTDTVTTAEYTSDNSVIVKITDHRGNILHQRTTPIDYGNAKPATDRVSARCDMIDAWSSDRKKETSNGQEQG